MSCRVFFGGSFSPPHVGHHQLLVRLSQEAEVEAVHLVPTGINPLKKQEYFFDSSGRRALIEAWVEVIRRDYRDLASKLSVETFELESTKPSFTVASLRRLSKTHRHAKWVLAMGSDNLPELPKWKAIVELLSELEAVWLFARGGYELAPREIPPDLREACAWRLFPETLEWISSTELREVDLASDATQAKLRPYLLDNVFAAFSGLLAQKSRIQ